MNCIICEKITEYHDFCSEHSYLRTYDWNKYRKLYRQLQLDVSNEELIKIANLANHCFDYKERFGYFPRDQWFDGISDLIRIPIKVNDWSRFDSGIKLNLQ